MHHVIQYIVDNPVEKGWNKTWEAVDKLKEEAG
jgi:hypothetical protein